MSIDWAGRPIKVHSNTTVNDTPQYEIGSNIITVHRDPDGETHLEYRPKHDRHYERTEPRQTFS